MESVEDHVNRFKSQLEAVPSLPVQPVHVNCHTGSDHFTYEESLDLFKQVLDFQSQSPLKSISHETHRGRVLYSPFTTLRLLKQFPTLRLTLDISHWNVVSERLIDPKILSPIFDRVDHIHARVGSHESPQVDDTRERDGNYQKFTLYHENIWKQVWKAQREAGRQVSTLTPEYGPAEDGYMPSMLRISSEGKKERVPLGKLDELIVSEYHELQKTFDAASE